MSLEKCGVGARWGLALGLWLCSAAPAAAQVNTERLRIGDPEEGLHGDLKADLAFKAGNVELLQLGASGRTFYQAGIHTPLLFARGELGTQNDERFTENGFVHARWTAMWQPRWGSEVYGQVQYDAFINLKFRKLIGAGPRFAILLEDWVELFLGTSYMIEHEVLSIPSSDPHPRETLYHRWSNYVSVKLAVSETLAVSNVVYVQPRWVDFGDVRVLDDLELQLEANDYVAIVNSLSFRYDSDPPSSVRSYDIDLKVGVRITSDPAL